MDGHVAAFSNKYYVAAKLCVHIIITLIIHNVILMFW